MASSNPSSGPDSWSTNCSRVCLYLPETDRQSVLAEHRSDGHPRNIGDFRGIVLGDESGLDHIHRDSCYFVAGIARFDSFRARLSLLRRLPALANSPVKVKPFRIKMAMEPMTTSAGMAIPQKR